MFLPGFILSLYIWSWGLGAVMDMFNVIVFSDITSFRLKSVLEAQPNTVDLDVPLGVIVIDLPHSVDDGAYRSSVVWVNSTIPSAPSAPAWTVHVQEEIPEGNVPPGLIAASEPSKTKLEPVTWATEEQKSMSER